MRKHRTYSIVFKRRVAEEYLAGESFYGLSRRHDLSRTLIRMWVEKYEAGAFGEEALHEDGERVSRHDPSPSQKDRWARSLASRSSSGTASMYQYVSAGFVWPSQVLSLYIS